jgi:hypothetical protein
MFRDLLRGRYRIKGDRAGRPYDLRKYITREYRIPLDIFR